MLPAHEGSGQILEFGLHFSGAATAYCLKTLSCDSIGVELAGDSTADAAHRVACGYREGDRRGVPVVGQFEILAPERRWRCILVVSQSAIWRRAAALSSRGWSRSRMERCSSTG